MLQVIRPGVRLMAPVMLAAVIFAAGLEVGRTRGVPLVFKDAIWTIGILEGSSPLALSPSKLTSNPVLTAQDVRDRKALFVADPFMINHNGTWYMFMEVLNSLNRQGDIGLATSRDGRTWTYERIVLDEPFHLSYPFSLPVGRGILSCPREQQSQIRQVVPRRPLPLHMDIRPEPAEWRCLCRQHHCALPGPLVDVYLYLARRAPALPRLLHHGAVGGA